MGEVFLFDVSVVVFFVGAGAGEDNWLFAFLAIFYEMPVEELVTVVGVEAAQRERQGRFNVFDLVEDIALSGTPDGSLFSPASGYVDSADVLTGGGCAAMGDRVDLEEPWLRLFPLACFDRDVITQKSSGLSGGDS